MSRSKITDIDIIINLIQGKWEVKPPDRFSKEEYLIVERNDGYYFTRTYVTPNGIEKQDGPLNKMQVYIEKREVIVDTGCVGCFIVGDINEEEAKIIWVDSSLNNIREQHLLRIF